MGYPDKRDAYFDNLRFILMFTVVFCHSIARFRSKGIELCTIHNSLLLFVMPLFVFVSGFFAKSMGQADNPKRSKILNLFLLYFVTQIIKCIIQGSFTMIKPIYGNWYLICLIAWYMLLPLISGIKRWVIISFSVLFGLLIGIETSGMNILQISRMVCFFPFFLLGYYLEKGTIEYIKRKHCLGIIGFIVACVALFFLISKGMPYSIMHGSQNYKEMKLSIPKGLLYRMIWYCLSAFTCLCIMCFVPAKKNIFTVIGTRTLPIFILHTCLFYYIIKHTNIINYITNNVQTGYILIGGFVVSFFITIIFGTPFFSKLFDALMKYDFQHQKE